MRTTRAAILMLCAAVVAAITVVAFSTREPSYDGRSLSEWVMDVGGGPADIGAAKIAISHIGTNAFPYFIHWIQYRPLSRNTYLRWLPPSIGVSTEQYLRANRAAVTFGFVGEAPDSVLRKLAHLAQDQDKNISARAKKALLSMGEHSCAALSILMTNSPPIYRRRAISSLFLERPPPIDATNAVPNLIRCLNDPDEVVRSFATGALQRIQPQALK
jgi:hypothetical protein